LTSTGGKITLNQGLSGEDYSLALEAAGGIYLRGTSQVGSLTVKSAANLSGTIRSSGNQTYSSAVTLASGTYIVTYGDTGAGGFGGLGGSGGPGASGCTGGSGLGGLPNIAGTGVNAGGGTDGTGQPGQSEQQGARQLGNGRWGAGDKETIF